MGRSERRRQKRKKAGLGVRKTVRETAQEAGGWTLRHCALNAGWRELGLAQLLVVRQPPRGLHLAAALFLIDLGLLGVKDVVFKPKASLGEVRMMLDQMEQLGGVEACSIDFAARLVEEAKAWAARFGFAPTPELALPALLLGDADPGRSEEPIPFGRNGKPMLTVFPGDPKALDLLAQLDQRVGPDGYEYMGPPEFIEQAVRRGLIRSAPGSVLTHLS